MEVKNYSKTTTESTHEGRVIADSWEWTPSGNPVVSGNLTSQTFDIQISQRERVYKKMPDGSYNWYYRDTLDPDHKINISGLWRPEDIIKFIESEKAKNKDWEKLINKGKE